MMSSDNTRTRASCLNETRVRFDIILGGLKFYSIEFEKVGDFDSRTQQMIRVVNITCSSNLTIYNILIRYYNKYLTKLHELFECMIYILEFDSKTHLSKSSS